MIENPILKNTVNKDSKLKEIIVNYVGNILKPDKEEVTMEMIIEIFSKEFPELLLTLCEERYMIGFIEGIDYVNQFNNPSEEKKEND